jgi:hypothetical protein
LQLRAAAFVFERRRCVCHSCTPPWHPMGPCQLNWILLMEQYWTIPNASSGTSKSISIFRRHSENQGSAHFSFVQ